MTVVMETVDLEEGDTGAVEEDLVAAAEDSEGEAATGRGGRLE